MAASERERMPLLGREDGPALGVGARRDGARAHRRPVWFAALVAFALLSLVLVAVRARRRGDDAAADDPAACAARNATWAADGFVVVLNTFRRNACLQLAFSHWASCPAVRQIRVSWSDVERRPPAWLRGCAAATPDRFVVDAYATNRLSNRFRPLPSAPSDALFSVDDDVFFDCALATEAHAEWRRLRAAAAGAAGGAAGGASDESARAAAAAGAAPMVGFAPRLLLPAGGYDKMAAFLSPFRKNTLFATKGAFVAKADYDLLWAPGLRALLETVDAHTTAEDIALSVVFAAARRLPPVHVAAHRSQVVDLCCTGSTIGHEGLASVAPANHVARARDAVCQAARGSALFSRTAGHRAAIQREAVRLAGGAIYELNTSRVAVLPSTAALLAAELTAEAAVARPGDARIDRNPFKAYVKKRFVPVR
jgi:hypothetical protein